MKDISRPLVAIDWQSPLLLLIVALIAILLTLA